MLMDTTTDIEVLNRLLKKYDNWKCHFSSYQIDRQLLKLIIFNEDLNSKEEILSIECYSCKFFSGETTCHNAHLEIKKENGYLVLFNQQTDFRIESSILDFKVNHSYLRLYYERETAILKTFSKNTSEVNQLLRQYDNGMCYLTSYLITHRFLELTVCHHAFEDLHIVCYYCQYVAVKTHLCNLHLQIKEGDYLTLLDESANFQIKAGIIHFLRRNYFKAVFSQQFPLPLKI
jgi:hypothetical protein